MVVHGVGPNRAGEVQKLSLALAGSRWLSQGSSVKTLG
jgi:hypothetical protein